MSRMASFTDSAEPFRYFVRLFTFGSKPVNRQDVSEFTLLASDIQEAYGVAKDSLRDDGVYRCVWKRDSQFVADELMACSGIEHGPYGESFAVLVVEKDSDFWLVHGGTAEHGTLTAVNRTPAPVFVTEYSGWSTADEAYETDGIRGLAHFVSSARAEASLAWRSLVERLAELGDHDDVAPDARKLAQDIGKNAGALYEALWDGSFCEDDYGLFARNVDSLEWGRIAALASELALRCHLVAAVELKVKRLGEEHGFEPTLGSVRDQIESSRQRREPTIVRHDEPF